MPTALTDLQKAEREQARKQLQQDMVREDWASRLGQAESLCQDAATAFDSGNVSEKAAWLVVGLFERQEYEVRKGNRCSQRSVYFDGIAPRANGLWGVRGFAARMARKVPEFVKSSGNGYLYLTDLGLALALHLRKQFPQLEAQAPNIYRGIELLPDFKIPNVIWRKWA